MARFMSIVWRDSALAGVAMVSGMVAVAAAAPLSSHPVALAVGRGDCQSAAKLVNSGAKSNDPQAVFLGRA